MSEVVSVCENACQGFNWLSTSLNVVGPLAALVGAIWVFYAQRKADRKHQELIEKRRLFRDFVSQIEKCTHVWQRGDKEDWNLNPEIRRLWSLQSEIALTGSETANTATAAVVQAVNDLFMRDDKKVLSKDGTERSRWDNVAYEGRLVLTALKRELEK